MCPQKRAYFNVGKGTKNKNTVQAGRYQGDGREVVGIN